MIALATCRAAPVAAALAIAMAAAALTAAALTAAALAPAPFRAAASPPPVKKPRADAWTLFAFCVRAS